MSFSVILSIVLFVLSMLIFFSVRSSDKKSRSLANVNTQIKSFRGEVSATTQRLLTTAQDCTDNVNSHIEKARNLVDIINASLDKLAQHEKDLSRLQGVCVTYSRALEKLKVQTDQAENRVLAVQQEVRKAETITTFVKNFHEETELLVNQMQDLKADYVRLVTSTQESLKQQAALQKKENSEMLSSFQSVIERQKAQFVEFVNVEKQGFTRECAEQERIAEANTEKLRASRDEVDEAVRNASASIASLKESCRAFIDAAGEDGKRIRQELNESLDNIKGIFEQWQEKLDNKADEASLRLSQAFDQAYASFTEKKIRSEADADAKAGEIEKRIDSKEIEIKDSVAEAMHQIEDRIYTLNKEKDAYTERARSGYKAALVAELEEINVRYESIKTQVAEQIASLVDRARETRETVSLLSQGEDKKISETVSTLKELGDKIASSEALLSTIQEQVTQGKQELYEIQQNHGRMVGMINDAQKELDKAEEEVRSAKEEKMKQEAEAVKLKLENAKKESMAKPGEGKKSRAESIIQEFPEDIFIGDEEEIDLSDDE